jgi:hypothetical protein
MEIDGGETASFIVRTYTFLTVASLVKKKIIIIITEEYT